ncbi:hypothetical protein U1Q18_033170 [Sarracenia purpurea var. burkii]
MGRLATQLAHQTTKLDKLQQLCFNIMKQINWNEEFSYEIINTFLQLANIIANDLPDSRFERVKRICLCEKAKSILPLDIFRKICNLVEDYLERIKQIIVLSHFKINITIPNQTNVCPNQLWSAT